MRRGIAEFVRGKHTPLKLHCGMHDNAWVGNAVEAGKEMCVHPRLDRFWERIEISLSSGTSLVNHRTPLTERWGGWYVTGTHGAQTHRGNLMASSIT